MKRTYGTDYKLHISLDNFINYKNPFRTFEYLNEGEYKMEVLVEKSVKLDDGKYKGKIVKIEERTEPYHYLDIVIKESTTGGNLTVGYPMKITEESALGKCIVRFGGELKVGEKLKLENIFAVSLDVVFMTLNKKSDKGEFTNILKETLGKA